jgi:hypothetical protein
MEPAEHIDAETEPEAEALARALVDRRYPKG